MRLEPLYTLRFHYPEGWAVELTGPSGKEEHHFYPADGRCEGRITGTFRGANHPRRRADDTFAMDLRGSLQTDDGATIMVEYQGYGRSRARSDELYAAAGLAGPTTRFRRQVVGFARHLASSPDYARWNDAVCALTGEVRTPPEIPDAQRKQSDVQLVFRV